MAEQLMAQGCAVCPSARKIAAIFRASVLVLLTATAAHAQQAASNSNPLPYSKGFLVTGDYVAAGVDLTPMANPAVNGFATGTITISGVPANADIVGAFLYWEQVFVYSPPANPAAGAKFNGSLLSPTNTKVSAFQLPSKPATCWGAAGSPSAFVGEYRSDVLYLLPKRFDVNNQWTGKYLVNGQFTVTLPEEGPGNGAIETSGATLVIVYRDPSMPLKKVLLFDGAYAQPEGATMTQALRGFYKSGAASASVTFAVGTGGNNQTEAVLFNNTVVSTTDPFPQTSPSSDRSWATTTYGPNVLGPLMSLDTNNGDGYGETATVSITANANPQACRTVAAIVFSTTVADVDHDGIPDGIEDGGVTNDPPTAANPAGALLPNLNAMGASSSHPDIFIEMNAMYAVPGTSYGSAAAPFNSATNTVMDGAGHNHLPTPDVLKMIGDVYAAHGIVAHFDVGDPAAYHNLGPQYVCSAPSCNDNYLIPAAYARGGEQIQERACSNANGKAVKCQFADFPGTVGWKLGLEFYRNAPVADDGTELTVAQINDPNTPWKNGTRRRRFDRNRVDYFHYVLYAHARGKAKSTFPCLDITNGLPGNPTGYAPDSTCNLPGMLKDNPDYHVPLSVSGVADLPGNSVMVTVGLWDNFIGTPFVIASTTLHELGHNLNLWHGGAPAVWGDAKTATFVEPNCKPNYLSSMNYLFQMHGLYDNAGAIHIDYSGSAQSSLDENGLLDMALGPAPPAYAPAWFAPSGSVLAQSLGVSAATRFCNGVRFSSDPAVPAPSSMARVFAPSTTAAVDWNGDGVINSAGPQNANYDATATGVEIISTLNGYNDWSNVRLDQIGAGRSETKISDGNFTTLGSGDVLDFGSGDMLDFGSGDFIDLGSGDVLDFGSGNYLDFGNGNFLDTNSSVADPTSGDFIDLGSGDVLDFGSGDVLDFGSGDVLDFGSGDILDFGSGSESQEIDYDKLRSFGRAAPSGLSGCVISSPGCLQVPKTDPTYQHVLLTWSAPTFGRLASYQIFRKRGTGSYQLIGTVLPPSMPPGAPPATTFIDPNSVSPNQPYTYYVIAVISDELPKPNTGRSNLVTIIR